MKSFFERSLVFDYRKYERQNLTFVFEFRIAFSLHFCVRVAVKNFQTTIGILYSLKTTGYQQHNDMYLVKIDSKLEYVKFISIT